MNDKPRALSIAILALGGEGGGVLADWIVALAERHGHFAQTTSVPGVAQRTGATIYYVEIFPQAVPTGAPEPVLALMPVPGHVDVVIASELMEAGRAIQRGLVSPERTTFIASKARVYALAEKMLLGDGRVDAEALATAVRAAGKHVVLADFAQAAAQAGSVVSAALFGALAATHALPYSDDAFRTTVRDAGVGVESSLRAFDAGHALAGRPDPAAAPPTAASAAPVFAERVAARFGSQLSAEVARLAALGLQRLYDFQDARYGDDYLDRLAAIVAGDPAPDGTQSLSAAVARHLALWMSYEDVIRVADLKTRATRFDRLRGEARPSDDGLVKVFEYFHPRVDEIADLLPPRLGRWLMRPGWANRLVARLTAQGRTVETTSLRGFLMLAGLSSLRRWRRHTLRHETEMRRIEAWLQKIRDAAMHDYALAVSIAEAQRLVKGYGDTHARGLANLESVLAALPRLRAGTEPAGALRELCRAALADDHGNALQLALAKATA